MRTKGRYNKDAHLVISDAGSETKSELFNKIACACEMNSIPLAKFDGDPQRTSYARYAQKDTMGFATKVQDAILGCKAFNIETDSLEIADALRADTPVILIDLPARSIEKVLNMFGDIESFYSLFEINETNLHFDIPVVSPKSFLTIKALYQSVDSFDLENPVTFNIVRNVGYSKFLKNLSAVDELYENDTFIQDMRTNPKFILVEATNKAMFDDKGYMTEALEGKKLLEVITMQRNSFHGAVPVMIAAVKKDVEEIYTKMIATK